MEEARNINGTGAGGMDEIFFRDENGQLKVLRNGVISDAPVEGDVPSINAPAPAGPAIDLQSQVNQVIDELGLHFKDDQLRKRFYNLALSYLKRIRDVLEVKEMLASPRETGGLGFSPEEVQRVAGVLRATLTKQDDALSHATTPVFLPNAFTDPSFDEDDTAEEKKTFPSEPPLTTKKPLPKPIVQHVVHTEPLLLAQKGTPVKQSAVPTARPKVQDVRFTPRLTGPIEEIRAFTIKDFRQIGDTPDVAIQKVKEKIDLLEQDSFAKRIEGIKAWKESEVYQTYLAIAGESLGGRTPIETVIANRTAQGLPVLQEEEIESIIKLNTLLRY